MRRGRGAAAAAANAVATKPALQPSGSLKTRYRGVRKDHGADLRPRFGTLGGRPELVRDLRLGRGCCSGLRCGGERPTRSGMSSTVESFSGPRPAQPPPHKSTDFAVVSTKKYHPRRRRWCRRIVKVTVIHRHRLSTTEISPLLRAGKLCLSILILRRWMKTMIPSVPLLSLKRWQ
ncbi:hypothetical protein F3Y22_tig00000646pilonHSYRG00028 [Hibiscus syriacus]|uniref:Uncharacterized protein n=1 Tax=Hibiscus syriacus TaxID=106335 RepID=A0A6A3D2R3_HIBSY|nr:hypothetical protein F3Y22_tig00000646pilonHSYRG00028 [Hibiscus syriacus]